MKAFQECRFLVVCLGLVVAGAAHVAAQQQAEELTIYPYESQIGTVARRVFRDSEARVTKTIYYRLRQHFRSAKGPYSEEMLAVQSIVLHKYDEGSRQTRAEHYDPHMVLQRIRLTKYNSQGEKASEMWLRSDGSREYEIRYSKHGSPSHLYFDESGTKLVAISGVLPQDVDLAYGWGKEVDGLSCGIAPSSPRGPLEEIRIYASVRNQSEHPAEVLTALPYQTVQMVLRDGQGALVPQDEEYIGKRNSALVRLNRGPSDNLQTLAADQARHYRSYELREWYSGLAPGSYSLTVRRRASGEEFSLVSNTISIEITKRRER